MSHGRKWFSEKSLLFLCPYSRELYTHASDMSTQLLFPGSNFNVKHIFLPVICRLCMFSPVFLAMLHPDMMVAAGYVHKNNLRGKLVQVVVMIALNRSRIANSAGFRKRKIIEKWLKWISFCYLVEDEPTIFPLVTVRCSLVQITFLYVQEMKVKL